MFWIHGIAYLAWEHS